MRPKDEAIKALTTVIEKIEHADFQDAFARRILKATAEYALEQVQQLSERRSRKAQA